MRATTLPSALLIIQSIIGREVGLPSDDLGPEVRFDDGLTLSSLETTRILLEVEDEFEVEISDVDALGFATLGDIVAYVEAARRG